MAATMSATAFAEHTIYGKDDRQEVYAVKNPRVRKMAESTVALFEEAKVHIDGKIAKLDSMKHEMGVVSRVAHKLCDGAAFSGKAEGAFCTGTLVGDDLILTAGHCVTTKEECKTTKFVFGFSVETEGAGDPKTVPAGEVYGCSLLVKREQVEEPDPIFSFPFMHMPPFDSFENFSFSNPEPSFRFNAQPRAPSGAAAPIPVKDLGADWALIKLDRKVAHHKPLKLNRGAPPKKDDPIFVIGHPDGLSTKVAGSAAVRDPKSESPFFTANLDTFGGNSGSPVINARTGLIEGVLVRGDADYEYDSINDCAKPKVCADDACRGEDVTKASRFSSLVPKPRRSVLGSILKPLGALERLIALSDHPANWTP